MSAHTILVIDDSATIRRLVDTTLSPVGYQVVLAATAEEGLAKAREVSPSLIVLDHQLPGTTGKEVCRRLLEDDRLKNIPIVASSTLRKKAYVEYADCPNVVDMLPKPYTPELLVTTVAHTLDTGSLVVGSQRDGTAVPEVIDTPDQLDLQCDPEAFGLREVIDFLMNTEKDGRLEVEINNRRVWIYVGHGRIQAVTASGIDVDAVTRLLPETLEDLGPVLQLTVQGGACSQIQGLVQLLDNKVLDPRLLRKLLRHQASILVHECFAEAPTAIRFVKHVSPPPLHARLLLDSSPVALLVEAALRIGDEAPMAQGRDGTYVRKNTRGQNLDRGGLSATHQKILSMANEPVTPEQVAQKLQLDVAEVHWVLEAMVRAELLDVQGEGGTVRMVLLESEREPGNAIRSVVDSRSGVLLKAVRDKLTYQLVTRRYPPDVVICDVDGEAGKSVLETIVATPGDRPPVVGLTSDPNSLPSDLREALVHVVPRPYQPEEVVDRCLRIVQERLEPAAG